MVKKVFIISVVLFFLVGVFYLIYNFWLNGDESENKNIAEIFMQKENKDGATNAEKISKILEGPIMGLTLDESENKLQYYSFREKGIWTASFDGSIKKRLSNDEWPNLKEVLWNYKNKKEALLKIADSFYLYNFGNKEKNIKKTEALNWISFNQKILYTYRNFSTNKVTLNIADPDGANWKEISELETDNIKINHIPQSAKSFFYPKPSGLKEGNMNIIASGGGEIEKKGALKFGSDYLWSNDGSKFLRSSVSSGGSVGSLALEVCEARNETCKDLGLPTLANKCTWSKENKYVFCALPTNLSSEMLMPDDYLSSKIFTRDIFWKINISNGKKDRLVDDKLIKDDLDATNLIVSPNENFLFFIDRRSGGVFRVII